MRDMRGKPTHIISLRIQNSPTASPRLGGGVWAVCNHARHFDHAHQSRWPPPGHLRPGRPRLRRSHGGWSSMGARCPAGWPASSLTPWGAGPNPGDQDDEAQAPSPQPAHQDDLGVPRMASPLPWAALRNGGIVRGSASSRSGQVQIRGAAPATSQLLALLHVVMPLDGGVSSPGAAPRASAMRRANQPDTVRPSRAARHATSWAWAAGTVAHSPVLLPRGGWLRAI